MKKTMSRVCCIVILTSLFVACRTEQNPPNIITFSEADTLNELGTPMSFMFPFNGENVLVTWETNTPVPPYGIIWKTINLDSLIEDGFWISSLTYAPFGNDLIFVIGYKNGEVGGTEIVRVGMDDLLPVWNQPLSGFNAGSPVIKGTNVYVSAIGSIGKIDLTSGKYIWVHEDLYDQETQDFTAFQRPVFENDRIIFQGLNIMVPCPKRIEVNDISGEIAGFYETCYP